MSPSENAIDEHVDGEADTVFAYDRKIPEGAAYWASGGFESQDATEAGWEEAAGAVQSGQSSVHTFETTGTHEYYCAPHEATWSGQSSSNNSHTATRPSSLVSFPAREHACTAECDENEIANEAAGEEDDWDDERPEDVDEVRERAEL